MAMIRPETEMKDSGIAWIGDIPSNWETIPLKKIVVDRAGGAWGNEPYENNSTICMRIADFDFDRGVFQDKSETELTKRSYKECQIDKLLLQTNDICIEKSGGGEKTPVGRAVLFDKPYDALFANFMDRIRVDNAVSFPKYIEYYLRAMYFLSVTTLYIKQTTGIQNLNVTSLLEKEVITLPSLSEQQAIADYLDETCSKIDEIIAEAKASIDEYKELRIAIIDDFTICGFNKTKLKYISKKIGDGLHGTPQYSDNGTVAFINGTNIGDEKITIKSNTNFVSIDEAEKHKNELNSQTILISLNGTIGNSSLYDGENIILGKSAGYITLKNNVCREYVRYCLENSVTKEAFDLSLNGTTIPNLSLNTLRNTEICLPDYSVQKQLAKTIKKMIIKMDSLISEKESLINDLEAYKKSLIYEVVTGKRKVV